MELKLVSAELIPVKEWNWFLFEVTYHAPGRTKVIHLVSTDTHIDNEVEDSWPSSYYDEYSWKCIREVARPRQIGTLHGMRVDEHPRTAGEREARGGE